MFGSTGVTPLGGVTGVVLANAGVDVVLGGVTGGGAGWASACDRLKVEETQARMHHCFHAALPGTRRFDQRSTSFLRSRAEPRASTAPDNHLFVSSI